MYWIPWVPPLLILAGVERRSAVSVKSSLLFMIYGRQLLEGKFSSRNSAPNPVEITPSLRRSRQRRLLKNGVPFDYRDRHPDLFSEAAMKRMIDELDARSALENDIDGGGGNGAAGSNESDVGRAARCRELPGRSRAVIQEQGGPSLLQNSRPQVPGWGAVFPERGEVLQMRSDPSWDCPKCRLFSGRLGATSVGRETFHSSNQQFCKWHVCKLATTV